MALSPVSAVFPIKRYPGKEWIRNRPQDYTLKLLLITFFWLIIKFKNHFWNEKYTSNSWLLLLDKLRQWSKKFTVQNINVHEYVHKLYEVWYTVLQVCLHSLGMIRSANLCKPTLTYFRNFGCAALKQVETDLPWNYDAC
jgi:hypothetical protein